MISPDFFGRYPRSSLHSFGPPPPAPPTPLSTSLISGHLASVDVKQNVLGKATRFQARSKDPRGGRWSWTFKLAQKRSSVGRWSWATKVGLRVVPQHQCNGHCAGSFSYTSRVDFDFMWGVSLTHPVLPSFLCGEFLLHIPFCLDFYAGSFSYTSRAGFFSNLGSFSYTSCAVVFVFCFWFSFFFLFFFFLSFFIGGVSLTRPVLVSFFITGISLTHHVMT